MPHFPFTLAATLIQNTINHLKYNTVSSLPTYLLPTYSTYNSDTQQISVRSLISLLILLLSKSLYNGTLHPLMLYISFTSRLVAEKRRIEATRNAKISLSLSLSLSFSPPHIPPPSRFYSFPPEYQKRWGNILSSYLMCQIEGGKLKQTRHINGYLEDTE